MNLVIYLFNEMRKCELIRFLELTQFSVRLEYKNGESLLL